MIRSRKRRILREPLSRRKRQHNRRSTNRRIRGGNNQIRLDIFFNNIKVTKGQQLERSQVLSAPTFRFQTAQTAQTTNQTPNLYTLIMWDPDVPTASQPAWAHYIIIDIDSNSQNGKTLLDYMPPKPPSGIHRYFFTLYKQAVTVTSAVIAPQRANFDLDFFVTTNKLQKAAETYIKVAA